MAERGVAMTFTSPKNNTVFQIKDDATWPSIVFQLDGAGSYSFSWSINWKTFKKSGQVPATGSRWDATSSVSNFGGTLTVHAQGAGKSASISVKLIGANPTAEQVRQYLASKPDSAGFDKILEHESGMTHFTAQGEPKKSFDNGYGMAQLTNPAPSYEQVWNWKLNIDAALSLFAGKRASAIQYLSQQNRTYTADQLKYETV